MNEVVVEKILKVNLTPQDIAASYWSLDSIQQAIFFDELGRLAELEKSPMALQMQHLYVREECVKLSKRAISTYLDVFASAFMYASRLIYP